MKAETHLQKAMRVLEEAGFHVDRAYEENHRDIKLPPEIGFPSSKTGAICLRITPEEG